MTQHNMQAGVFLGKRRMERREVPLPTPERGQVLLKVTACGVCGTDYHIFQGEMTRGVVPPVVLGHEIAGVVEQVGRDVETLQPGQFCAVDPVIGCGVCDKCRSGVTNLCLNPQIIGYKLNGGFAQHVLVPACKVVPMDAKVGPAGGILCETLACVLRGYDRLGFRAGATAMILGAGTVGLLWAQMLASSPCARLIQTEIAPYRMEKARKLGAQVVLDARDADLPARVREHCPDGVDFIIDATGEPAAVEQAIPLLAFGGTFMAFGVCPAGSSVRFDPAEMFQKETTFIGSKMPPGTLDRAARLIESGRIACDEIVTSAIGLDELADCLAGFNDLRGRDVKVSLDPWR